MESKGEMEQLVIENRSLIHQVEGSKQLLRSLLEQIQEVMAVNNAVSVQLEQSADIRSYLSKASMEFGKKMGECNQIIGELANTRGDKDNTIAASVMQAEIDKFQNKNRELEESNTQLQRLYSEQKLQMTKQERWIKQLSNVVQSLSHKLDDRGDKIQILIEKQLETEEQLHKSQAVFSELSMVNRDLLSKLKDSMARGIASTSDENEEHMLEQMVRENLNMKQELSNAREKIKELSQCEIDKQVIDKVRQENKDLTARVEKLDKLRKATNQRAHALAKEKQALATRVCRQKDTIITLRKQLSSSESSRPTTPRWK
ncbi:hypothetical protein AAMO2058_001495000 [Amorphochlora amoebiformis]